MLYIDFQKAYDCVPHKRLLKSISKYGVKGKIVNWITALLTNRRQRVVVNESFSEWAPVVSGVTQGSVLEPILFLLYADDAKTFRSITDETQEEKLQSDLTGTYKFPAV